MHLLRGLRRVKTAECLPELRRRLCAAPDPAGKGMAGRRVRDQARAVGQARAPEIFTRGYRGALCTGEGYSAGGAVGPSSVIASAAKQSTYPLAALWIASLRSQRRR